MIEIFFTACLSASPTTCEERSLLYQDLTPVACVRGAQPALADWVAGHPNWRIARWGCRMLRPGEREV